MPSFWERFRDALRPTVELLLSTALPGSRVQRLDVLPIQRRDERWWAQASVAFSVDRAGVTRLFRGAIDFPLDTGPDVTAAAVAMIADALQRGQDHPEHEPQAEPEDEGTAPG